MVTYKSTREEVENSGTDTAVLPIGSVEQHGPHLPIGTDCMIAEKIAAAVCERMGGMLLPVLPISTCIEHRGSRGSVWMKSHTVYSIIQDITECLKMQGFKRLLLVIGHGGVFIAGPAVREINSTNEDIKLIRVDLVSFLESLESKGLLECHNNLHACESETSLMLYLHEDLVRKEKIEDCIPDVPRDFLNYDSMLKFSKNGVWGRPSLASAQKGEQIFKHLIQQSMDYISTVNKVFEE